MLNRISSPNQNQTEAEHGFDLREGIGFLWRQWIFIASIVAAVIFIAAIYEFTQIPRYTATAQVLLEQPETNPEKEGATFTGFYLDVANIENQLAIIKSTVFLQRVVEKLDLTTDPEFGSRHPAAPPAGSPETPQSPSLIGWVRSLIHIPSVSTGETKPPAQENSGNSDDLPADILRSINALRGSITAARLGQGWILGISVTSVDPARASRVANAVADLYVVEKLNARFDAAKRASSWLSDRLVELRTQLRDSEEAVAQFRADHHLPQTGNNITLSQQQLSDLNNKLVEARTDVAQKKARIDLLRSIIERGGDIQSLPNLPTTPQLTALRTQEADQSQKVAELSTRFNESYPLLVNARTELADIKRAIAAQMRQLGAGVQNEYELAEANEAAVERTVREATGQTDIDDKTAISLRELERTAAVNKNLFEDFLSKAKISQEQSTFEARDARVITPALPPGAPSYPRKGQFMTLAFLFGLFLGIGGAVAKDKLNGGFATPRQIEDALQIPLLSSVNLMQSSDLIVKGKKVRLPYYPAVSPLSRFSESVRMLRTGIQMADVDHPPKVIQVTSTVPGEGKTTIALALAVSAAASGLKVLFMDGDLRRTSATHFFNLLKSRGLVDVLIGNGNLQDAIVYVEDVKLWVLPAGSKTRTPADLLGSDRMKSFLNVCQTTFDCIVIDSPPVGPVVDALIISHLADSIVYVVRWAATARELVQQSIERLPGTKIAGTVFNQVNERAAQKYGRYAYQYYYGPRSFKKYYSE
jgi:polysaccharide biosynthesis transport protein